MAKPKALTQPPSAIDVPRTARQGAAIVFAESSLLMTSLEREIPDEDGRQILGSQHRANSDHGAAAATWHPSLQLNETYLRITNESIAGHPVAAQKSAANIIAVARGRAQCRF